MIEALHDIERIVEDNERNKAINDLLDRWWLKQSRLEDKMSND